jgi:hypothetical protein
MIMEGLETMLSDAVSISALLAYDNKLTKFCLLKKQMSNISTPSPAASPGPDGTLLDTDAISASVLANIEKVEPGREEVSRPDPPSLPPVLQASTVELSEFFPRAAPARQDSPAAVEQPPLPGPLPALTILKPSGMSARF